MNEEKIFEELEKYIQSIDADYEITVENGDLNLYSKNYQTVCCFVNFKADEFYLLENALKDKKEFNHYMKMISTFHDKAVELMDKYRAKYTVQIFRKERGYLHVNYDRKDYNDVAYDVGRYEDMDYFIQTKFTKSEIEELKKRDDLAVDWDKAIVKEVTD